MAAIIADGASQSYNVKAELKGDLSVNVGYDFGFVEPVADCV